MIFFENSNKNPNSASWEKCWHYPKTQFFHAHFNEVIKYIHENEIAIALNVNTLNF